VRSRGFRVLEIPDELELTEAIAWINRRACPDDGTYCYRDRTPLSRTETGVVTKPGKFWVDERVMRVPYYGIYQVSNERLERCVTLR